MQVHVCMSVSMCACVCICMLRSLLNFVDSQVSPTFFLGDRISHWSRILQVSEDGWLGSLSDPTAIAFPVLDYNSAFGFFSIWVLGIKITSLCLQSRHHTNWAVIFSPHFPLLKKFLWIRVKRTYLIPLSLCCLLDLQTVSPLLQTSTLQVALW